MCLFAVEMVRWSDLVVLAVLVLVLARPATARGLRGVDPASGTALSGAAEGGLQSEGVDATTGDAVSGETAAAPAIEDKPVDIPVVENVVPNHAGDLATSYIVTFKTISNAAEVEARLQQSAAAAVAAAAQADAAVAAAVAATAQADPAVAQTDSGAGAAGPGLFKITSTFSVGASAAAGAAEPAAAAPAAAADNLVRGMVLELPSTPLVAAPVVAALQQDPLVQSVLRNFKVELNQVAQCVPATGLSGLSLVPDPSFAWSTTCFSSSTRLVWYGERCGETFSQIRWLGLYAVNRTTGLPLSGCTKLRRTTSSARNDAFNARFLGDCGTAPITASKLPTTVCAATSGGAGPACFQATLSAKAAAPSVPVISAVATLAAPVVCGKRTATTVSLTGTRCGPNGGFVQWNSARPGGCATISRSLSNTMRNADWLGNCGVPGARLRQVGVQACAQQDAGGGPASNLLPRVEAASTDLIPRGVQRLEAAAGTPTLVPNVGSPPNPAAAAVLDTGVFLHPDLNVVGGVSFVGSSPDPYEDLVGHGTHVAGIIGARNGGGYTIGVSPGAPLYSVRVMTGQSGGGGDVFAAFYWVVNTAKSNKIRVINLSFGAVFPSRDELLPYCDVFGEVVGQGVTVVVSAGNSATDLQTQWPAGCPQVLVVTSITDLDGQPSSDDVASSYSNFLDTSSPTATSADRGRVLAAPGWDIVSTVPPNLTPDGSGVSSKSGTSQAAPHISGVVLNCYLMGSCSSPTSSEHAKVVAAAASRYAADPTGSYGFRGDPARAPAASKYYGYLATAKLF